ncbi:MAG: choice-of-anchor D domain-containing protein [Candidatus Brocadiae bacterium]|nr:choice-of-anchor D domain-containing protein [Candidatus Brocadiia bacterium]
MHHFYFILFTILLVLAGNANAITLYTTDFINDSTRTNFNGFEGMISSSGTTPDYTENGIRVQQINGDGSDIWTTYSGGGAYFGSRSWYPSGGDNGYTKITLTNNGDFGSMGMRIGNGWGGSTAYLHYMLRNNGVNVFSGVVNIGPSFIGFQGGGYNEVLIKYTQSSSGTAIDSAFQAGQIDNIEVQTTGTVVSPSISANNINFGNVRVGTSSSSSITVSNTGASGSTLTGNINAASGNFSPTSGSQSFSLGSGSSASRTFTYSPTARGTQSVDVSITSNAQNITRTLTGTGVSPVFSSSVAAGSTINFGEVEYIANQSLSIQNLTPDADLGNLTNMTLLSATITGPDASYFTLENFTPGTQLSKGQLQNLAIRFMHNYTGRDEYGYVRNATLTFTTDVNAALGSNGSTYSFNLQATTIPEPCTITMLGFFVLVCFYTRKFKKN